MSQVATTVGTMLKVNVNILPLCGFHMEDYDFNIVFYTNFGSKLVVSKDAMIKTDKDNFVAILDTTILGPGDVRALINAKIPDKDFESGFRSEVVSVVTGISVIPYPKV